VVEFDEEDIRVFDELSGDEESEEEAAATPPPASQDSSKGGASMVTPPQGAAVFEFGRHCKEDEGLPPIYEFASEKDPRWTLDGKRIARMMRDQIVIGRILRKE
jgi:hypothetical protein